MDQRFARLKPLRTGYQIALQHDTDDAAVSAGNLARYIPADSPLTGMVLVAIGMASIDHDVGFQPGLLQLAAGRFYGLSRVIHAALATS